jgi:ribosomal protein S6--L-glutamate ligase
MPIANSIADDRISKKTRRDPRLRIGIAAERRYLDQLQPAGLAAALELAGHAATLLDPEDVDTDSLLDIDLLVARGRSPAMLDLLDTAESLGIPTVNRRSAIAAVLNKVSMALALEAAGVPTPTTRFGNPLALAEASRSSDFPMVVKPVFGDNARGVRVVRTRAELVASRFDEPVALAQPLIASDGFDLKLYVAGEHVYAARKPSPIASGPAAPAHPVETTPALRDLALRCGSLFGLELFGVDCIATQHGPVVIEVNDFPNYSAIERADECLARYVVARARGVPPGGGRR